MRNILCFGDSNTFGLKPIETFDHVERYDRNVRWPALMASKLGAGYHVIEEALPGRTISAKDPLEGDHKSAKLILPAILESHWPLDTIIVMLGTNDCKDRFSLSADEIAWSMGNLVNELKGAAVWGADGPDVVLVSPAKIYARGVLKDWFSKGPEKSQALGGLYQEWAQKLGVRFFDANKVASCDTADGVHLDAQSHFALAEQMHQLMLG